MEKAYTKSVPSTSDEFTAAREHLEQVIGQLQSPAALKRRHDETDKSIHQEGQELCRLLYQAALILDFIHVLEYLWRAAWCFFDSSDKDQAKEAEQWVLEKAGAILDGRSGNVASGIRNKAKHPCHPLLDRVIELR